MNFYLNCLIFLVFLFASTRCQGINYCNVLPPPVTSLPLSSLCSNFSLFFNYSTADSNANPHVLCLSTTNDRFIYADNAFTTQVSLMPEKTRTFSTLDLCIEMMGKYSTNNFICSNGGDLVRWQLIPGTAFAYIGDTGVLISRLETFSQENPNWIIFQDSAGNISVVDGIDMSLMVKMPGTNFFTIKNDIFGLEITNTTSKTKTIQIFNITSNSIQNQAILDLVQHFYIEIGSYKGVLGFRNNIISFWNYNTASNPTQLTQLDVNVKDMKVVNLKYIIMIGSDNSIFMLDLTSLSKIMIEPAASKAPQFYTNYAQDLIFISSYTNYLYNIVTHSLSKALNINTLLVYYLTNDKKSLFTLENDQTLKQFNFTDCAPQKILESTNYDFNTAFSFEQDVTRVGLLNNGNQILVLDLLSDNSYKSYTNSAFNTLNCISAVHVPSSNNEDNVVLDCRDLTTALHNIYVFNLNEQTLTKSTMNDFNSTLSFFTYMNFDDLIAFEWGGYIHVYSVYRRVLMNKWAHLQTTINGLFTLMKSPNTIGSTSTLDFKVWDIYTGVLMKSIASSEYSFEACETVNSVNKTSNVAACFVRDNNANTASIKFYDLEKSPKFMSEFKDPIYFAQSSLQYFQMKSILLDKNYLLVSNNKKTDLWDLSAGSITKSLSTTRISSSSTLMMFLSSETMIMDITPNSLLIWDFSKTKNSNTCIGNYFTNTSSQSCLPCSVACHSNSFCINASACYFPKCSYFLAESPSSYASCLQGKTVTTSNQYNAMCVNNTNVTDISNQKDYFCYDCNSGYFLDYLLLNRSSCRPCDSSCGSCFGNSSSQCLSCSDSNYHLDNNYQCVKNASLDKIIIIVVFSTVGGIIIILLWFYLYNLHKKMQDKMGFTKEKKDLLSPEALDPHDLEHLFSEVYHNEEYLAYLEKTTGTLKNNIHAKMTSKGKEKILTTYLTRIHKNIPDHYYDVKDTKENCFKLVVDVVQSDLIGVGSLGSVYIVENHNQQKFTWKMIINGSDEIVHEKIDFLMSIPEENLYLKKENILTGCALVGVGGCTLPNTLAFGFVQEYFEYNLPSFMGKYRGNNELSFRVIKMMCSMLKEFAQAKYIHGNLKSFNVLINYSEDYQNSLRIGLSDPKKFNSLGKLIKSIHRLNKTKLRLAYIPPEMFVKGGVFEYHENHDIWGIGMIIFEMFYNDNELYQLLLPWIDVLAKDINENDRNEEMIDEVRDLIKEEKNSKDRSEYCLKNSFVHLEITEIINCCLQINPSKRINIKELIEKIEKLEMIIPKNEKFGKSPTKLKNYPSP